jgi:hypothetical protein
MRIKLARATLLLGQYLRAVAFSKAFLLRRPQLLTPYQPTQPV